MTSLESIILRISNAKIVKTNINYSSIIPALFGHFGVKKVTFELEIVTKWGTGGQFTNLSMPPMPLAHCLVTLIGFS